MIISQNEESINLSEYWNDDFFSVANNFSIELPNMCTITSYNNKKQYTFCYF